MIIQEINEDRVTKKRLFWPRSWRPRVRQAPPLPSGMIGSLIISPGGWLMA